MKRVIDEATRKKLVGLLPFAPGSQVPFTPDHLLSLEEAVRPVFYIRPLTESARLNISKWALDEDGMSKTRIVEVLSMGSLVGWTNVCDAVTLEDIPFDIKVIVDWPDKIVMGIYYKVAEITAGPSEVEKESLESLPPSASEPSNNPVPSADASPA